MAIPPSSEKRELIRECAWCRKRFLEGEWTFKYETEEGERVTHGICKACSDAVKRK